MELLNVKKMIKDKPLINMYSIMNITPRSRIEPDKYYYYIKRYGFNYNDIDGYYFEDYIDFQNYYLSHLNDYEYDCQLGSALLSVIYRVYSYVQ